MSHYLSEYRIRNILLEAELKKIQEEKANGLNTSWYNPQIHGQQEKQQSK